jgi:hypothetical protein
MGTGVDAVCAIDISAIKNGWRTMIECIFTLDYEVYGNGWGSLRELVHDPAERLISVFQEQGMRFVTFVEAAELEILGRHGTDPHADLVRHQIRRLRRQGFEIGLHLHPQWYNARQEHGRWVMDESEYNLCLLPRDRIVNIVDRAVAYLREVLEEAEFTPVSFRAGNWLFQPTRVLAEVLAHKGIKVDSSVFKGGLQRRLNLDYRQTVRNGYYWTFGEQVETVDPDGALLELPIHTQMVPFWRLLTRERLKLQRDGKSRGPALRGSTRSRLDYMRVFYPMKLDFCRMRLDELRRAVDAVLKEDAGDPGRFRPLVAIGHTKDLVGVETVKSFLSFLVSKRVKVSTLEAAHDRCRAWPKH